MAAQPPVLSIAVVPPLTEDATAQHAAEEFASYLGDMTGARVTLSRQPEHDADITFRLVVGNVPALNDLPGSDHADLIVDGFTIKSTGPAEATIAAMGSSGLLYGVYHYLEKECHVGFFWDGEHVPHMKTLPVDGLDYTVLPRWSVRNFGLSQVWALAKFHHQFRSLAQKKYILDWFAKRKINWTAQALYPTPACGGSPVEEVYVSTDAYPEHHTHDGWPGTWDLPVVLRTRYNQEEMRFARARGISYVFPISYGFVPCPFAEQHPEYHYLSDIGYGSAVLHPEDPHIEELTLAYGRALIEEYGTDHVYHDTPLAESLGGLSLDEAFAAKLEAAKGMYKTFRKLDPQATWQWDSWDFAALPMLWTPDRIREYLATLPHENMRFYELMDFDTEPDPPIFELTGYYPDTPWMFGILHSFQGDDHPHGHMKGIISRIQELAENPAARSCIGVYHAPEISGHNGIYFDLTTQLAWDPEGITLESFLNNYALRRYGDRDAHAMTAAWKDIVDAFYADDVPYQDMPIYKKLGKPHITHPAPAFKNNICEPGIVHTPRDPERFDSMLAGLQGALLVRNTQSGNPLYEEDLVEFTRGMLGFLVTRTLYDAYEAVGQGDEARFTHASALTKLCMARLLDLLATRPDYSLQRQIDRVMEIEGVNPELDWCMKQHAINWLYATNDIYELHYWFYGPRVTRYLAALEKRLQEGVKGLPYETVAEEFDSIEERWLEKDIEVPQDNRYDGTTIEAVLTAYHDVAKSKKEFRKIVEDSVAPFQVPDGAVIFKVAGKQIEMSGTWFAVSNSSSFANGSRWAPAGDGERVLTWHLEHLPEGEYDLFAWVPDDPNRDHAAAAPYTILHNGGETLVTVDQQSSARSWHRLGTFGLDAQSVVRLTNDCHLNPVADALMAIPADR